MRMKHPRFTSTVLTLTLAAALTGCLPRPKENILTTAAPYQEEMPGQQEQPEDLEEQKHTQQEQFSRLEQEIFLEEVSDCQLNLQYLLRHPENYGITGADHLFPPISLEIMEENRQKREMLQAQLDSFDPALLSSDQKLTLRILQSSLKIQAMGDGMELYNQPLAPTIGLQAELPIMLSEYAFYDRQDVEEYLALLDGIDEYYQGILTFEQKIADAGLMMSDSVLDHVIESCESYLLVPGDNFLIDSFRERLAGVPGLTDEEKASYEERNSALLEQSFVPAYQLLIDGLQALKGTGVNERGMCGFPEGQEYYTYMVFSGTGMSYGSIDDLISAVETSIIKNLQKTSQLLKDHPQLQAQLDSYQFRQTEAPAMLQELEQLCAEDFPPLSRCRYTMKDVPKGLELSLSPAFYLTSPIDDITENVIYINRNPRYPEEDLFPTIAHEGYPGHLYQNVYFHSTCKSDLRKLLSFPGYNEGWATYVENLSYTMDNGLDPVLGQLLAANSMANLGIHAYLDLAVNYLGWDKKQVRKYLAQMYTDPDAVADDVFEVMVENPSNYLSYYVGALEFQNMRTLAEQELGPKFNAKAFHQFLLDMGNAPFDVIQAYFSSWLMEQKI